MWRFVAPLSKHLLNSCKWDMQLFNPETVSIPNTGHTFIWLLFSGGILSLRRCMCLYNPSQEGYIALLAPSQSWPSKAMFSQTRSVQMFVRKGQLQHTSLLSDQTLIYPIFRFCSLMLSIIYFQLNLFEAMFIVLMVEKKIVMYSSVVKADFFSDMGLKHSKIKMFCWVEIQKQSAELITN